MTKKKVKIMKITEEDLNMGDDFFRKASSGNINRSSDVSGLVNKKDITVLKPPVKLKIRKDVRPMTDRERLYDSTEREVLGLMKKHRKKAHKRALEKALDSLD